MRLGEKCTQVRECCVCHARASFNFKRPPAGEPEILSISLSVYLRKNGARLFKSCPRVSICLSCLKGIADIAGYADAIEARDSQKEWAWRGGRFQRALVASILSISALEQYATRGWVAKNA